MNRLVLLSLTTGLLSAYALLLVATQKPRVSEEYRDYYIKGHTAFWKPKRYEAKLEEGIDLRKDGLPSFVRNLSGISYAEEWGRWSDAKTGDGVRIEFQQAFRGDVCVELTARPATSQLDHNVDIILGEAKAVVKTSKVQSATYSRTIKTRNATRLLLIRPQAPAPAQWDQNSLRTRRLGLAIEKITARPGSCSGEITSTDPQTNQKWSR